MAVEGLSRLMKKMDDSPFALENGKRMCGPEPDAAFIAASALPTAFYGLLRGLSLAATTHAMCAGASPFPGVGLYFRDV